MGSRLLNSVVECIVVFGIYFSIFAFPFIAGGLWRIMPVLWIYRVIFAIVSLLLVVKGRCDSLSSLAVFLSVYLGTLGLFFTPGRSVLSGLLRGDPNREPEK